jgi:hypothetical protein
MSPSWRSRNVSEAVAIHGLPRTYGARNDEKFFTNDEVRKDLENLIEGEIIWQRNRLKI